MNRIAFALGVCSLGLAIALAVITSRYQSAQRHVEKLQTQLQLMQRAMPEHSPATLIAEQSAPATTASKSGQSSEADDTPESSSDVAPEVREAQLLRDAEYRELRIEGDKHALWLIHAEAISATLPSDLADRLMKLLAQHRLEGAERPRGMPEGISRNDPRIDPNNPPAWLATLQQRERRQEAEVEALLGPTKYRDWIDFYQTRSARYEVMLLGNDVERLGDPLRAAQRKALVDLIADEEKRQVSGRPSGSSPFKAGTPEDHLVTLEADAQRIAESAERLRQLAASYLTPRQLEVYETSLARKVARAKVQVDLQRASVEVMRGADSPRIQQ